MANFFDDDENGDLTTANYNNNEQHDDSNPPRAGPSRQSVNANANRQYQYGDRDRDRERSRSDSLPPPLAQYNDNNNKGKNRAVAGHRHARESSTMSIDLNEPTRGGHTTRTTTTTTAAGGGRRDRGFLADDDNDNYNDDGFNLQPRNNDRRGSLLPEEEEGNGRQQEREGNGNNNNDESDVQQLMRIYMDERMSPELLKFPDELIHSLMENLEAQTEAASVLLSSGLTSKPEEHERLLLVQMEIERVRWLLRSYLRTRTYKIEKQAQYLLKTPLAKRKMSDIESGYAERYQALTFKHFDQAVIGNIPERLGRLDEEEMIVKPDLDQAVFARARRDCPTIILPDQQSLTMKKGDIHLVRYKSVRRLIRDGDVRLV